MRHYLLFIIFVMPISLIAQPAYIPVLEEGKVWHYTYSNWATGKTYKYSQSLTGDTLVAGRTYMKYLNQDGSISGLLREDADKVYILNTNVSPNAETMLYDFSLAVGDYAEKVSENEGILLADISIVNVMGNARKEYNFVSYIVGEGGRVEMEIQDIWVEGMGSNGGLLTPFPSILTGNFVRLDYIEMPDGTQFSFDDILRVEPSTVKEKEAKSDAIYDLQGRKVSQSNKVTKYQSNMLPKGIYIQNGKKFVVK